MLLGPLNFIRSFMFIVFSIGWVNCFASSNLDIQTSLMQSTKRFVTWQGIEPDKWATLWMIKRYISPQAYFLLIPPNADLPSDAIPFGIPDSAIRRAKKISMFRRLKTAMNLDTPALNYLDQIIDDIEVNIWDKPSNPHSIWFETLYRQLQERYHRDQVPIDCYLRFFDEIEQLAGQIDVSADEYSNKLSLQKQCPGLVLHSTESVGQANHIDILREIGLGKKIMFVDTREEEEYNEVHLPGSTILQLRNVNEDSVKAFAEADWVIPYCVKDFRGFEVAKAMQQLGVQNVATLSPNGLKGWLRAALPIVKTGQISDQQAYQQLLHCATEPQACLKEQN